MKTMENKKYWICKLCGATSEDYDQKNYSFNEHLMHHKITQEKYKYFVEEEHGGISKLKVKMINYSNNIEHAIIAFVSQTWGPTFDLNDYSENQIESILEDALSNKTLPTALESIQFTFQIDGISRAATHQLVRVRIGSGFSQKGMSDTYYGDTDYVIPASIEAVGKTKEYMDLMKKCNAFYDELFNLGVPYQDARFVIPHAATSSVVWTVNYLALKNFCGKRMQSDQNWEMNSLCKLIKKEIEKVYPALAKALVPNCEIKKKCMAFGNLFEGCGKFDDYRKHKNRFVFSKDQMGKNIVFDGSYINKMGLHNQSVKKKNNHFIELAREKQHDN